MQLGLVDDETERYHLTLFDLPVRHVSAPRSSQNLVPPSTLSCSQYLTSPSIRRPLPWAS